VIPKSQSSQPPTSIDETHIDARKAQLAAARARLDDSLHEFSDNSRTLLWGMALPFACGAVVAGLAFLMFKSRKPRTFALVQFVTQPPPKLPAAPGIASAAWDAGTKIVLPQLMELLSPKRTTDNNATENSPVAH
jgi:hypothetical protein